MKHTLLYILLFFLFTGLNAQIGNSNKGISTTIGNGRVGFRYVDTGVDYEFEAERYFDAMTVELADDTKTKINDLCGCFKDSLAVDSLPEVFDVMYILANETEEAALKNLVKRSHDATKVNSPAFTAWEGFTGNGSDNCINTNWNGRTSDAVVYTLNSASFGIYYRTNTVGTAYESNGCYSTTADGGTANRIRIDRDNNYSNSYYCAVNGTYATASSTDRLNGMYIASRTASNVVKLYVNNIAKVNATTASTKIPNQNVHVLALLTNGGSLALYENDQISLAFLGKGLSAAEERKVTNCFEYYMILNDKGLALELFKDNNDNIFYDNDNKTFIVQK